MPRPDRPGRLRRTPARQHTNAWLCGPAVEDMPELYFEA